MRVCLASTSPARLALLAQAGITPETIAPGVDEDAVVAQIETAQGHSLSPREHVGVLAASKAEAATQILVRDDPEFDGIVIGGDSMFEYAGHLWGKPLRPATAVDRWKAMRGGTGTLYSGHAVHRIIPGKPARVVADVASATVSFAADMSDEEIAAYVATGEPLQVAGGFTVDSLGGPFITRVEGDPSTVVGMSLSVLRALVRQLGVNWPDLWNPS